MEDKSFCSRCPPFPISADELVAKFHNCLRANCSEHETHEDCEKSLIAQLIAYGEERYQDGIGDSKMIDAAHDQGFKLGYQRGIAEAAERVDSIWDKHTHCEAELVLEECLEAIRGLGK